MPTNQSWLDFLSAYTAAQVNGTTVSQARSKLNFLSSNFALTDNAANDSTDITFTIPSAVTYLPYVTTSGTMPATTGTALIQQVNSHLGAIALTLPNLPTGVSLQILDSGLYCGTNHITITDPNGYKIQNPQTGLLQTSYVMSVSGMSPKWLLIADFTNSTFWMSI